VHIIVGVIQEKHKYSDDKINDVLMKRWKKDTCVGTLPINVGRGDSQKCGSSGRSDLRSK
jgi:hypothetical protein